MVLKMWEPKYKNCGGIDDVYLGLSCDRSYTYLTCVDLNGKLILGHCLIVFDGETGRYSICSNVGGRFPFELDGARRIFANR